MAVSLGSAGNQVRDPGCDVEFMDGWTTRLIGIARCTTKHPGMSRSTNSTPAAIRMKDACAGVPALEPFERCLDRLPLARARQDRHGAARATSRPTIAAAAGQPVVQAGRADRRNPMTPTDPSAVAVPPPAAWPAPIAGSTGSLSALILTADASQKMDSVRPANPSNVIQLCAVTSCDKVIIFQSPASHLLSDGKLMPGPSSTNPSKVARTSASQAAASGCERIASRASLDLRLQMSPHRPHSGGG